MKYIAYNLPTTLLVFAAILFTSTFFFLVGTTPAVAAPSDYPTELTGYIWAGTQDAADGTAQGIGWISLNCENESPSCPVDYGVEITDGGSDVNGYLLQGEAWAGGATSSIGWVTFEPSDCPAQDPTDCRARLNPVTLEFTGWARACSVYVSGCSGALKSNADKLADWDGWISLNSANHSGAISYGVAINGAGTNFDPASWAWGSNVLGQVGSWGMAGLRSRGGPGDPDDGLACVAEQGTTYECIGNISSSTTVYPSCYTETDSIDCTSSGDVCNPSTGQCVASFTASGTIEVSPSIARRGSDVEVTWSGVTGAGASCEVAVSDGGSIPIAAADGSDTYTINANITTFTIECNGMPGDSVTVEAIGTSFES